MATELCDARADGDATTKKPSSGRAPAYFTLSKAKGLPLLFGGIFRKTQDDLRRQDECATGGDGVDTNSRDDGQNGIVANAAATRSSIRFCAGRGGCF